MLGVPFNLLIRKLKPTCKLDLEGSGRLWQIHKAQFFILSSAPFFVSLPGQDFNQVRDLGYLWSHLSSLPSSLQSSLNLSTASPEAFCDYLHQFSPGLSSQPLTNIPGSNLHSLQFISIILRITKTWALVTALLRNFSTDTVLRSNLFRPQIKIFHNLPQTAFSHSRFPYTLLFITAQNPKKLAFSNPVFKIPFALRDIVQMLAPAGRLPWFSN